MLDAKNENYIKLMLKIKTLIKKQKLEFSYVWGKIRNEETSASLKS